LSRICRVLRYQDETERAASEKRLLTHAVTLNDVLGRPIAWTEAAQAMAAGFHAALGWELDWGGSKSMKEPAPLRAGA
jgi:hypothetical protein